MSSRIIRTRFAAKSAALFLALLASQAALGDGYCKWTDEDGVVHYAERCPEEADTSQVSIRPPPAEDLIQDARSRSEALLSDVETRRQEKAEDDLNKKAAAATRANNKRARRQRCIDAMIDLHNLREGEAMYFDNKGELHDQFSIHSNSYSGERVYLSDAEHKALIEANEDTVDSDCVQSRNEIIIRIKSLAVTSDSQICNNLYERFLKENRFDSSTDIEELQSMEKSVLELCN